MTSRPHRTLLVAGAAAALALLAGPRSRSGGEVLAADAPPAPAKRTLDAAERTRLQTLLRSYLDVEAADTFKARTQLVEALRNLKASGLDLLADREALMPLVYAARPFAPAFERRLLTKEDRDAKAAIDFDNATQIVSVRWGDLRLSVSLPTGYEDARKGRKLNAMAPFPAIVTLHELSDFMGEREQKEHPGTEAIKRRWARRATKVPDGWLVFAPVAPRAQFVTADRPEIARVPLRELWTRYHVDVDRLVLEGGADAVAFAAAQPNFYAGLVVRDADRVEPLAADLVRNLSTLSVYAVGAAESRFVQGLLEAGFPKDQLTTGGAEGLPEWLACPTLKRVVPRSFSWTVKDHDVHQLAHWVNIEQVEAGGAATMKVEVVNDAETQNTIQITSTGVRNLTLFLSDEVVDLNRPVRLVVNGTPMREVRVHSSRSPEGVLVKLPEKFEQHRTLDNVFDLIPEFWPRKRMYYGWTFPLAFLKIPVRSDAKPEDGAAPAPTASGGGEVPSTGDPERDRAERNANQYFTKAVEREQGGELQKALDLFRKAVEEGQTSVHDRAAAKVKELEGKLEGGGALR